MLVVHRSDGSLEHRTFSDIVDYTMTGDAMVVNATSVFRARLLGTRETGGGAAAEIFLLRETGPNRFEAMVHPGGKLHPGRRIRIAPELSVVVERVTDRRTRIVRVESSLPLWEAVQRYGHVPLPPYIQRPDQERDEESYQTMFAREVGSVAAPTAGLHFTPAVVGALRKRGVRMEEIVLHVGAGTFKPVRSEDPAGHAMHEEWYFMSDEAAAALNETKRAGRRVWAVGTTVLRTLESIWLKYGALKGDSGETTLFVRPPFEFRVVDHLLTNFHLPRSTLLMLVAAFAGYDLTMHAYDEAIRSGYRFYSYGDAMLIL
jgi:S-adenosylmethionine:tRNA ribosyltransferase-isomerase